MNADRRKTLTAAVDLLSQSLAKLEEAKDLVEGAASDEREYYDNMPEALQSGEKGSTADQAASDLEEATSNIDEWIGGLGDAIANIESARDGG